MKNLLVNFKPTEPWWKAVASRTYSVSFLTLLVLTATEYVVPGFVTNWFNPLLLLPIVVVSAILATVE